VVLAAVLLAGGGGLLAVNNGLHGKSQEAAESASGLPP
jgi:hypothetical protein